MHRRCFLESLNTLVLGMFLHDNATSLQPTTVPMRIALLSVTNAPTNGMELGVEESRHAAALLKRDIEFIRVIGPAELLSESMTGITQQQHVSAMVGGGSLPLTASLGQLALRCNIPFINTACTADELRENSCSRFSFHVAPTERMKLAARALASASGAAACSAWHSSLTRYGADTLNARFRAKFGAPMTEADWAQWFAIKVLWESFLRAGTGDSKALLAVLENAASRFDGHKGKALSFRPWDHQLRQPLYVETASESGTTAVREVPGPSDADEAADLALDRLAGTDRTRCSWTS